MRQEGEGYRLWFCRGKMCLCFPWASCRADWTCHCLFLVLWSSSKWPDFTVITTCMEVYPVSLCGGKGLGWSLMESFTVRNANFSINWCRTVNSVQKILKSMWRCSDCALFLTSQVTLGAGAKDELHTVEVEALDYEGNPTKVVLASLKMSVQPTVSAESWENLL